MENFSACDSPEFLEEFIAILSGKPLAPWDVRNAKQHLQSCKYCESRNPDATERLTALQQGVENDIANQIASLEFAFSDARISFNTFVKRQNESLESLSPLETDERGHAVLSIEYLKASNERERIIDERVYTARCFLLAQLVAAGAAVLDALDYVHEMAGLASFSPIPVLENSEVEDAREQCARFIDYLPESTRSFVFQSTLASELIPVHLDPKSTLEEIEDAIREIGLEPNWLQRMIEHAAPLFLRDYLLKYPNSSPTAPSISKADPEAGTRFPQERRESFDFLRASLGAGFVGIEDKIDKLTRANRRARDFEADICERLGARVYLGLSRRTQRDLQLAECNFQDNQEPDDYSHSLLYYFRAYEVEFRQRLCEPLAAELLRRGVRDYPLGKESGFPPLLRDGKLVQDVSPGKIMKYLTNDSTIQEIVELLPFDIGTLRRRVNELANLRNAAIHREPATYDAACKVRELVLGRAGILTYLFADPK